MTDDCFDYLNQFLNTYIIYYIITVIITNSCVDLYLIKCIYIFHQWLLSRYTSTATSNETFSRMFAYNRIFNLISGSLAIQVINYENVTDSQHSLVVRI